MNHLQTSEMFSMEVVFPALREYYRYKCFPEVVFPALREYYRSKCLLWKLYSQLFGNTIGSDGLDYTVLLNYFVFIVSLNE